MRPALALAVVLAGCSPDADDALEALAGVKARACACHDKVCGTEAMTGLELWHDRYGKVDGTAAEAAKAQALIKETQKCVAPYGSYPTPAWLIRR